MILMLEWAECCSGNAQQARSTEYPWCARRCYPRSAEKLAPGQRLIPDAPEVAPVPGVFTAQQVVWRNDPEAWQTCCDLTEPLLQSFQPGCALLTREGIDTVAILLSYAG